MLKGVLGTKVQLREEYFSFIVQHHRAIRDTSELHMAESGDLEGSASCDLLKQKFVVFSPLLDPLI